jgi:hypothetical protein
MLLLVAVVDVRRVLPIVVAGVGGGGRGKDYHEADEGEEH